MRRTVWLWLLFGSFAAAVASGTPSKPPRYSFVTLGGPLLERSAFVGRVEARSAARAGPAVEVVRFAVVEAFLDRRRRRTSEIVALAAPGEYSAGVGYLVFLAPFGGGGRLRSLRRIVEGERDFADKARVLARICELEAIADERRRAAAIRDLLIEHLGSESLFVRWNALDELQSFLPGHRALFGAEARRRLVAELERARSAAFRRRLASLLRQLGLDWKGDREA